MEIRKLDTTLTSDDMRSLTFRLMNERFYLPDLLKNYSTLMETISRVVDDNPEFWGFYDGKELGGVVGIMDVKAEHDARFLMWCWDKKVMTHKTVRWIDEYLEWVADCFQLKRITVQTPCERLCRILKWIGFKVEGRFAKGYKHGGKLTTLFQLRRLREG